MTWSAPEVVLPWTDTTGNWDCGFCELIDGTWLVNLTITGHFKRGVRPEGVSWAAQPNTKEWGDWTWAYKLQSGSPLINKGVSQPGTLSAATKDFYGDSTPKGGKYDIGIDEVA